MRTAAIILRVIGRLATIAADFLDGRITDPARRVAEVWPQVQSALARAEWEDQHGD